MARALKVEIERFPIAGRFTIARGSRTEAAVVTATITDGSASGHGECVPYARYGETVEGVAEAIEAMAAQLGGGLTRQDLQSAMPAGAARNAVDCALWDLEAKLTGVPAHVAAGIDRLPPVTTAYTISLGSASEMFEAAAKAAARPILKIKLGAPEGDPERIAAVRRAAPDSTLIADANEGWTEANLEENLAACAAAGVQLIEQPVKADEDAILARIDRRVPLCADESLHDRSDLERLRGRYDAINIKLDKAGGLTEALALADDAQKLGFTIMIGCMLGTSLAMAPALLVSPRARFVDLDGPLLLARDREPGLTFEGSLVHPASRALWG
ncbi:N-acetyl-D-Glu racemase DgcA [Enterovirga rhinocerotis]|uniref:Dipeptide epimerase n=1 Tax=Enterovirga rhinocerotis TaxID=1339210 RepID=A0A4V6PZN6_9HYPH|nr:N-acetyl-D-Glu racemase DgcA [Enterovirga rhinocerotis]TDR94459.1 L-alanine-DL-glutamate epimerase-like enolase superfamily enzyme [Enterovirga rhinocerotis]